MLGRCVVSQEHQSLISVSFIVRLCWDILLFLQSCPNNLYVCETIVILHEKMSGFLYHKKKTYYLLIIFYIPDFIVCFILSILASQIYFPSGSLFCKIKPIWFSALNCRVAFLMAIDAWVQTSFFFFFFLVQLNSLLEIFVNNFPISLEVIVEVCYLECISWSSSLIQGHSPTLVRSWLMNSLFLLYYCFFNYCGNNSTKKCYHVNK